jgi:alpha-tubulin suppressor-like RCC1 family protein
VTARFEQISLGHMNSCARDELGHAWCWGANEHTNQNIAFGPDYVASFLRPRRIGLADVDSIATGWGLVIARTRDGTLWGWGDYSRASGDGTVGVLDSTGSWLALSSGRFNACA